MNRGFGCEGEPIEEGYYLAGRDHSTEVILDAKVMIEKGATFTTCSFTILQVGVSELGASILFAQDMLTREDPRYT